MYLGGGSMKAQTNIVEKIEEGLALAVRVLCVVMLALIVIVTAISVISRYFFFHPLNFANPLSIYLMMWISFLGSGIAIRKGEHIFVELFINKFVGRKRVRLLLLINIIVAIFLIIMIYYGFIFAFTGLQSTDAFVFGISMFIPYLSVPIGMLYMLIVVILRTIIEFKNSQNDTAIAVNKGGS